MNTPEQLVERLNNLQASLGTEFDSILRQHNVNAEGRKSVQESMDKLSDILKHVDDFDNLCHKIRNLTDRISAIEDQIKCLRR